MLVRFLTSGMGFPYIIAGCCIAFLSFMAAEDPLQQLLSKQDTFRKNHPQEKVHLHTDKPYYSLGDTIYFKAYVINAERNLPSSISRILYVDLIDQRKMVIQSGIFPVEEGTAWGNALLPDSLSEGSYTIRAYTNWMRNFDENFFFEKTVLVGDALTTDIAMNAERSFPDGNGQVQVNITYRYFQGQPVANKQVGYSIRTLSRELEKGSGLTDDSGRIMIRSTKLPAGFSYDLMTDLKLDNKRTVARTVLLEAQAAGSDIRFFPEGGQLVSGLRSRVGFKAASADGLGIDITGEVVDQNDARVTGFASGFAGIGSFELTPIAGKTYYAIVRFRDGKEKKLPLPQAAPQGYTLSVDNTQQDKLSVVITTNQTSSTNDVILVALSNNTIQYVGKTTLNTAMPGTTVLSKSRFPTGILQLTLFSAEYRPVAERLVFIRQNDQLSLQLSTANKTYGTREKVKLSLHATDAEGNGIPGSFSVAVTDESAAPFNEEHEQTILSDLLLNSDIRGYVQSPNHYFTAATPRKEKELDDLLLTQGWRRFTWNEMLADKQAALAFPAEKSLHISGKVTTPKGEPVANGNTTLLSKSGKGFVMNTTTGPDGRFRFEDLQHVDSMNFTLQAKSSTGSSNVRIELDPVFRQQVTISYNQADALLLGGASFTTFLQNSRHRFEELGRYMNLKPAATLKPVTVATKKLTKVQEAVKSSWNLNGPGNADQIITYLDLYNCNDIAMCLQGRLTGVVMKRVLDPVTGAIVMRAFSTRGTGDPMMIIVDGVIPSSSSLGDIPAANIQSIEVLRSGGYLNVYGTKGSQGVLVITTKKGDIDYNEGLNAVAGAQKISNIVFGSSRGYTVQKEFYSPDYGAAGKKGGMRDLRSTIYWKPDVATDEDGNASVEFYNADGPGTYRVIVEGISADGKMGRQQFRYEVR